jgi:hypothetical protein
MRDLLPPEGPYDGRERARLNANRIRMRRADARRRIARQTPQDGARQAAVILISVPDWAATMTVERLLSAVAYIGPVKARSLASTSAETPIAELHPSTRAAIAHRLVHAAAGLHGRRVHSHQSNRAQARLALERANHVRLARAGAIAEIKTAPSTGAAAARLCELLLDTGREACLDGLVLRKLIEAIPRAGRERALELLAELKMNRSTQLGALSAARARQLATAIRSRFYTPQLPPAASAPAQRPPALSRAA